MKNFIFAMCGFLMMSLVLLSVQASSVESPKREYVNPSVDVGLPDIQFITLETAPAYCVALTDHTSRLLGCKLTGYDVFDEEEAAIQGIRINVPKCPFRYIYKSNIVRIIAIPHIVN